MKQLFLSFLVVFLVFTTSTIAQETEKVVHQETTVVIPQTDTNDTTNTTLVNHPIETKTELTKASNA